MNGTIATSLGLLLAVAACAADGGRVHAPPVGDDETGSLEAAPAARVVPYDQPFLLDYDDEVEVEHSAARARFAELIEDSRCPVGVQCIQAGRARVRLEVLRGNG